MHRLFLAVGVVFAMSGAAFAAGQVQDGLSKVYRHEGSLHTLAGYENAQKDGVWLEYFPSGDIRMDKWYRDGVAHDLAKEFDVNGVLRRSVAYENGEIVKISHYDEKGYLFKEEKF